METKAPPPWETLDLDRLQPVARAWAEANRLKQLLRQGWLRRGVPRERCESVADHCFGTALLALWLADAHAPELDRERLLRIALVHDLGEVHAGDLTPADGVPDEEKRRRESESIRRVLGRLPGGERWVELWEEYEAGASAEARFVREVDRLEMALQSVVYESQGVGDLGEFRDSARAAIRSAPLLEILDRIERR